MADYIAIKERVIRHLDDHENSDLASKIWAGYMAALLEYGHIKPSEFDDIRTVLPIYPEIEMRTLFLDIDGDGSEE